MARQTLGLSVSTGCKWITLSYLGISLFVFQNSTFYLFFVVRHLWPVPTGGTRVLSNLNYPEYVR